jgi:hypothetical protein
MEKETAVPKKVKSINEKCYIMIHIYYTLHYILTRTTRVPFDQKYAVLIVEPKHQRSVCQRRKLKTRSCLACYE